MKVTPQHVRDNVAIRTLARVSALTGFPQASIFLLFSGRGESPHRRYTVSLLGNTDSPRALFMGRGQQIRCKSGADSNSLDGRE